MSNSYTFSIVDDETGLPRTGLTVTMRYSKDSFATTAYTAVEVDDENSPGEYRITNYVTAKYKTWINGSEDESFGGPNGKPLISEEDLILLDALSAYWDFKDKRAANINDPVNDKDGANKQWIVANYYNKTSVDNSLDAKVGTTGDEVIADKKQFYELPELIPFDVPDYYPVPTELGDMIYLKYFNYRLSLLNANPTPQSVQHVRVYGGATAISGKLYPNIADAVNWCVSYGTPPDATHIFVVTIENMGPGNSMLPAESGSIRDYVNLVAVNPGIVLIIGDDTLSANTSLENATLFFGAGEILGARAYTGLKLRNCRIYNYKNLTLTDGEVKDCVFISQTSYKVVLDDAVNVENCIFNEIPDVSTHTGVALYDTVTGVYTVPDDPTIPA